MLDLMWLLTTMQIVLQLLAQHDDDIDVLLLVHVGIAPISVSGSTFLPAFEQIKDCLPWQPVLDGLS